MTWFRCKRSGTSASVEILDDVGCFSQPASSLLRQIGDARNVHLSIDSCGGDAGCAFEILEGLAGCNVTATIRRAFSAAYTIALAAPRLRMERGGTVMVHSAKQAIVGNRMELIEAADHVGKMNARLCDLICARAKLPPKLVEGWLREGDHFLDSAEALQRNLVDVVFDPPALNLVPEQVCQNSGKPVPFSDVSEAMLREMLGHLGTITTPSKERLALHLREWWEKKVIET